MDTIPRLHKTRNLFGSQHVYSFWPFLQENSKLDSAHSMLPVPNPSVVPEAEQKNITHITNTTSDRASHPNSTVVEAAAFSNGSDVGTPATTTISVAPTQAGKKCMFGIRKFASWCFILFYFIFLRWGSFWIGLSKVTLWWQRGYADVHRSALREAAGKQTRRACQGGFTCWLKKKKMTTEKFHRQLRCKFVAHDSIELSRATWIKADSTARE